MTLQHPDGALPGAPTTTAQDVGVPPADGEMRDLFHRTDWAATPFGPVETWPPNLQLPRRRLPVLALPHAHLLGAGPAHALQRRLPQPARREQAPAGVGPFGAGRVARGLGCHRTDARGSREWWPGDLGRGRAARRRPQRLPRGGLLHVVLRRRPRRHRRGGRHPQRGHRDVGQGAGRASSRCVHSTSRHPGGRRGSRGRAPSLPRGAPLGQPRPPRERPPVGRPERPGAGGRRRRRSDGPRRARRRAGPRRAHRSPADDREPPPAVGSDAPALRRGVRLARGHGPERHPAPRRGAPPDGGPDRARQSPSPTSSRTSATSCARPSRSSLARCRTPSPTAGSTPSSASDSS